MSEVKTAGSSGLFIKGDVADVASHEGWIESIASRLGPITCLINNAGVNVPNRGDMLEATPESFDHVIGVNLRGTFFLTQAAARHMLDTCRAGMRQTIVVISSANAVMVSPEKAVYCLSKSALSMLAQLFAARLGAGGIEVFEIQPGLIKTQMNRAVWETYGTAIAAGASLIRRWGTPDDVAQVATALATGALPFSTGTMVPVGGGLHVHRL